MAKQLITRDQLTQLGWSDALVEEVLRVRLEMAENASVLDVEDPCIVTEQGDSATVICIELNSNHSSTTIEVM